MPGYAKQRTNWQDFPTTSTPILAANLNAFEQAIFDEKTAKLNPRDFGTVDLTGTGDSTTAVAAALSNIPASGALVDLDFGTYKITGTGLAGGAQRKVTIRGKGKGNTILNYTGTGTALTWGTGASTANMQFVLEDLTIQLTSSATVGVFLNGFQDWTFKNVEILGATGTTNGLQLTNVNSGTAINSDVRNCGGIGVKLDTTSNLNTFIGGQITGNAKAIDLSTSTGNRFLGPNIASTTASPAVAINGGQANEISGWFEANHSGASTYSIEIGASSASTANIINNSYFTETSVTYPVRLTNAVATKVIFSVFAGSGSTNTVRVESASSLTIYAFNHDPGALGFSDASGSIDTMGIGFGTNFNKGANGYVFTDAITGSGATSAAIRAAASSGVVRFLNSGATQVGQITAGGRLETSDGVQTKYLSGAGKTTVVDGDFTVAPPNGTLAVHFDSTATRTYLSVRSNGTWHVMAGPIV